MRNANSMKTKHKIISQDFKDIKIVTIKYGKKM